MRSTVKAPPRAARLEKPGFAIDAEPFGVLGLEALIDRIVWRAAREGAAC